MDGQKMKRNKKLITGIIIVTVVLMLTVTFAACENRQTVQENNAAEATRIVTDCMGRQVEIPEKVERIGCLYAFAGHITALLGEEDKMVAVVDGLKRDQLLTGMFPDILHKAVPFTEGSINMEELVKLDPDVVLIRKTTAENQAEMDRLEVLGIPALVIDSNTIEEQRASVKAVGEVFGGEAEKKAEHYDEIYRSAIRVAKQKKAQLKPEQIITVFHSINEATRTDGAGTLPAQWMALVGVENVSVKNDLNLLEGKLYAGLEQIYLWDPQVIICNEPGVAAYILSDGKWSGLRAVKQRKVYQMPIAISRWGHPGSMETPLAMMWLGKRIYPELYQDIDLEQETRDFYQYFFHYDLTDDEISMILSGEGMRKEKTNE